MKLTKKQQAVFVAAIEVVIDPGLRRNPNSTTARVGWQAVEELRAALDACGVDWRKAKVTHDRLLEERKVEVRG